jgi:hypothetical protein
MSPFSASISYQSRRQSTNAVGIVNRNPAAGPPMCGGIVVFARRCDRRRFLSFERIKLDSPRSSRNSTRGSRNQRASYEPNAPASVAVSRNSARYWPTPSPLTDPDHVSRVDATRTRPRENNSPASKIHALLRLWPQDANNPHLRPADRTRSTSPCRSPKSGNGQTCVNARGCRTNGVVSLVPFVRGTR